MKTINLKVLKLNYLILVGPPTVTDYVNRLTESIQSIFSNQPVADIGNQVMIYPTHCMIQGPY